MSKKNRKSNQTQNQVPATKNVNKGSDETKKSFFQNVRDGITEFPERHPKIVKGAKTTARVGITALGIVGGIFAVASVLFGDDDEKNPEILDVEMTEIDSEPEYDDQETEDPAEGDDSTEI